MMNRKLNSDNFVHTFKISNDRHFFTLDSKNTLIDDGEVSKVHFGDNLFELNGGFKKILVDVETDEAKTITKFFAIVDIYYVPPNNFVREIDLMKLGRVNYSGNLVRENSLKSSWKGNMIVTTAFKKEKPDNLPAKILEIGPGAFITAVVQALFGTLEGLKMLGLEGLKPPDSVNDEIKVIVT